jgi:hypothetical protein
MGMIEKGALPAYQQIMEAFSCPNPSGFNSQTYMQLKFFSQRMYCMIWSSSHQWQ